MLKYMKYEPTNDEMDSCAWAHGHAFMLRTKDHSRYALTSEATTASKLIQEGWKCTGEIHRQDFADLMGGYDG